MSKRRGITRRTFLKSSALGILTARLAVGMGAEASAGGPGRDEKGRESLKSGIPLGGIGAGTVEIRDDGLFHEWQVFSNWRSEELRFRIEDAFFALYTKAEDGKAAAHVLATESRAGLPPVRGIGYKGEFPFAILDYDVEDSPCTVRLTAFSPFIPHDSKNSGLPGAVFEFELTNAGSRPCEAAVSACLGNVVGYTHPGARARAESIHEDGWRGVSMGCEGVPDGVQSNGTMVLGAISNDAKINAGGDAREVMEPFAEHGVVKERKSASGDPSKPVAGAVSSAVTLKPGETKKLTFFLTWHFPYFIDAEHIDIGRMYSNWYDSASDAAGYLVANLSEMSSRTWEFHDVFYRSSLPRWLMDGINAQFTTLFKTSWWTLDGTFAIWEGMSCCGCQTADVAYYGSFPVIMLFPDLAKQAMRLTARFQNPSGRIPHFFPGTFQYPDAYHMIDLMPKFTLMVWRDYLWTGDRKYLDEMWPHVHAAMEHNRALDRNGDFICDNHGIDQTYDGWEFEGASIYVGLINSAGFKAASEMALLQGENDLARQYESLASIGAASLDRLLWNGEYYDLFYDITTGARDKCCMSDQMNGAWYAKVLELGEFLPDERVKSSLSSIYKYNRGEDCVNNGHWKENAPDHGGQWTSVWSGTEYMLASHMIYEGMTEQGMEIARTVYDRYAKQGRPWDHWECGDHYYRAMIVLTLLFAAQGFHYSAVDRRVVIDPRIRREKHVSPFITPGGWGQLTFAESGSSTKTKLELTSGELDLSILEIGSGHAGQVKASLDGKSISCALKEKDGRAALVFEPELSLKAGSILEVTLADA